MSIYDTLVGIIKTELKNTPHGRKLLEGWSDSQIKQELKDPCFFGAKPEMRDRLKAVKHFNRIAELRK